jgi:hypothetical protein
VVEAGSEDPYNESIELLATASAVTDQPPISPFTNGATLYGNFSWHFSLALTIDQWRSIGQ